MPTRTLIACAATATLLVAGCGNDELPYFPFPTDGAVDVGDATGDSGGGDVPDGGGSDAAPGDTSDPDGEGDVVAPDGGGSDSGSTDTGSDTNDSDSGRSDGGGTDAPNTCPTARASCSIDGGSGTDVLVVQPLETLICNGALSSDPDGAIREYAWSLASAPEASDSAIGTPDSSSATLFVDVSGTYRLELRVRDDDGCWSEPAVVSATAQTEGAIHVQLVWDTPGDEDRTDAGIGAGADLDLHLLHEGGCWNDRRLDCHYANTRPDWGEVGALNNPTLDADDTDGMGPENINLDAPESGVTYSVGIHYSDDHDYGPSYATVRIFLHGELAYEVSELELAERDVWWEVAAIAWPSLEVEPIEVSHTGVPACE